MTLEINSPQSNPTPIGQLGCGIPNVLAISPDNNVLAVACATGIWLYNVATGESITPAPLCNRDGTVTFCEAVTFSENGRWLATVNRLGVVNVFDMSSFACLMKLYPEELYFEDPWQHTANFFLCFSPDNRWFASSGGGYIHVWELGCYDTDGVSDIAPRSGSKNQVKLPCHRRSPIVFSPDSCMLAYVETDEWAPGDKAVLPTYISVCDIATRECHARIESSTDPIRSLCFSPCSQFVAAGGVETVQVWEIESGSVKWRSPEIARHKLVTYSSDGTLYSTELSYNLNNLIVYAWDTRQVSIMENALYTYTRTCSEIHPVTFHKGCLAFRSGLDFYVWTAENLHLRTFRHIHVDGAPERLQYSQDKQTLAAIYQNDGVVLWDTEEGLDQHPHVFNPVPATAYYISYDGCFYATNIEGNSVKVWDIRTNKTYAEITPSDVPWDETAFAPQNNWIAYGGRTGNVYVWDVENQKMLYTLIGHKTPVYEILFSPDEKYMISAGDHNSESECRLWDMANGTEIPEFYENLTFHVKRDIENFAFSPCSSQIIFSTEKDIEVWNLPTLDNVISIRNPLVGKILRTVALSPNGQLLAAGSWDKNDGGMEQGIVHLWRIPNGENIVTFEANTQLVLSLAFTPNGELLASGGFDGTILLWDLKPYLNK